MLRGGLLVSVASVLLLLGAPTAFADDCTDTGDCAMAPRNIDAATGVAAAGPAIALVWLYLSRRGGALLEREEPRSADELVADLTALKEEFERHQEELRDQAVQELRSIDEFMKKYDEKWREAMFALEDYLQEYQNLLPGLQKIWEQFGSREDARRIAEAADEVIMLTQVGVGLARSAASTAARETLQAARRAGTRVEADALRRSAREALGKQVQAMQAAERAAAQRGAREAAEQAAARKAAEQAAVRKAEEAALQRAMDDKIADLAARRARAEKEVLEQIRSVNPTGHQSNCVWASQAVEEGMAARGSIIAIPRGAPAKDIGWLEDLYRGKFTRMGDGAQGKAAIERLLAQNPGARGIVRVAWKGHPVGHAFNAVNKNGFVFYPDGQTGKMMNAWDQAAEVMFLRTN